MKTKIETTELLDYIELYNKYEYLIERTIMKICPKFIDNEDFIQDAKLGLLEYIEYDKRFSTLNTCTLRTEHIRRYIRTFISNLYEKYSEHNVNNDSVYLYNSDNISINNNYDYIDVRDSINKALSLLTEREVKVIRLRFFDGMPLSSIGNMEGLSSERIRQIEATALRKLRHPRSSKLLKIYIEN